MAHHARCRINPVSVQCLSSNSPSRMILRQSRVTHWPRLFRSIKKPALVVARAKRRGDCLVDSSARQARPMCVRDHLARTTVRVAGLLFYSHLQAYFRWVWLLVAIHNTPRWSLHFSVDWPSPISYRAYYPEEVPQDPPRAYTA